MVKRISISVYCLFLMVLPAFTGCQLKYHLNKQDALALAPDVNQITVSNNNIARAIKAAGGYKAWIDTKKMELDYIVTFYKPARAPTAETIQYAWGPDYYLTQQHYEIYPWSNSIRVSDTEPQDRFVWQLSQGNLEVLEGAKRFNSLPAAAQDRYFAEAILYLITAPARLVDSSARITDEIRPVKLEGLWYYPIERPSDNIDRYWSKVIFYQNTESALVDILWFAGVDSDKYFAVRGYDYRRISKNGVLIPAKIELFTTDAGNIIRQRLVKIDLK